MNKAQANKRNKRKLVSKQKKKERNIDRAKTSQTRIMKRAKLMQFLSQALQKKTASKE